MRDGFVVLAEFDMGVADVFGDLEAHFLGGVGEDIKCHLVHLNGCRIFLLVVVYVSHVHTDPASEGVLLPFDDFVVFCQGLLEHSACFEAEGVVKGNCEGKLHIDEVGSVGCLSLFPEILLLVGHFFCLFKGVKVLA